VVVLNGQTVDLTDLLGGEYGSHYRMIWSGTGRVNVCHKLTRITRITKKAAMGRPRLPAAAPTVRLFQDT